MPELSELTGLVRVYDDGGEWEGYYWNGKLLVENHRVSVWELLRALGIELEEIECDGQWLEENGTLPQSLTDVKEFEEEPEEEE